jgi:hypothetical protein
MLILWEGEREEKMYVYSDGKRQTGPGLKPKSCCGARSRRLKAALSRLKLGGFTGKTKRYFYFFAYPALTRWAKL